MFKKKPVVKSLAPLRSSDRRKVADQIIQQFKIEIPTPTAATSQEQPGAPPNEAATTLTALRKSLLPDNTMSARFTTTAGPDLTLVQGTIYVGSHADDDERILWLRPEQGAGTDGRLYPTVYTLWRHPRLVPLLHTPNLVMDKLYGDCGVCVTICIFLSQIDMAFHNAFLYCLYQHKNGTTPSTPDHGMSFPIQASFLISNLITPFLPIHSAQQSQFYNIKKTSWKNVKKFIKHLDKEGLVKAKDRNGGETIILDADFEAAQLANFVPYELPKKNSSDKAAKSVSLGGDDKDLAVGQSFTVKTLYRPSGKLTPTLFPPLSNKDVNNYYTSSDVSKRLNDYLTAQDPPIISTTNPRIISLNPFISNTILSSSPDDLAILKRGTIQRDAILRRLLEDPSLCAPYHAMLKPGQTLHDVKPKAGPGPKVTVTIERRTGSKVVTKITGLEPFGAAPQLLADELQKKCSSSTSVSQAVGAANGVMSVLVQGDHRKLVEAALANRGVKSQWIDIVDKSQKKGGK
ncbi:RNA binding protein Ligatin/Tma64 [Histoplasma capsulatum H143]|uniref:RNA binding protein Ligatin/Tma64 n=1 Tax=Ajellomyces capsulatus (strain H143) TaxID=544712 RepID=C6HIL1_AJECH|nr:RNA binding protein Ligatin/Tma64 [Histoplasma capsulatum H143]